jgi:hypothetical protein
MGLMIVFANTYISRSVFWVASISGGALSVICVRRRREDAPKRWREAPPPIRCGPESAPQTVLEHRRDGVVFTLARFSEAFLILRAADFGLPIALRRWCWSR